MKGSLGKIWMKLMMVTVISIISSHFAYAQTYKEVTMTVGETKTLYLPSSVTSKVLKSVAFYSNGISYVQVISYTNSSVTVKAIKAFSSPLIVRCDYYYYVKNGSYTYLATGFYDFRVTVVDSSGSGGSSVVQPTSIKFSSSVEAIEVGESVQLAPTVSPANAQYTLTWSISDKNVATVSQNGLLTGKSIGAADLKVMADNGVYAMLRVVVTEPTPTIVSVSPSSVTLTVGESKNLTATVYPSSSSQSVQWSSNNSSVVSVTSSGKITAIKAGIATITATSSKGTTGTCLVTCKEAIQGIVLSDNKGISQLPSKANVIYDRVFYSGWNSVCVPFAINQSMLSAFCEDSKIATVVGLEVIGNERRLSVKEVQSVSAGEPCLVYVPQNVTCQFLLSEVLLSPTPQNKGKMKGVYERTTIGANYYKLTSDGSSLGVTKADDAVVAPFRAYIVLDEESQTKSSSSPIKIKVTQVKY